MRSFFTDSSLLRRRRGNGMFSCFLTLFLCVLPKTAIGAEYSPERSDTTTVSSFFSSALEAPTNVIVTLYSCTESLNHSYDVRWEVPSSGDTPDYYDIYYGDGTDEGTLAVDLDGSDTDLAFIGDLPYTEFSNPGDAKIAVVSRGATTADTARSVFFDIQREPDVVTNFMTSVADGNDVTISWTDPQTGPRILSFVVQWRRDGTGPWEHLYAFRVSVTNSDYTFTHYDVPEGTHLYAVGTTGPCSSRSYAIPSDISWTETPATVAVQPELPQNLRAELDGDSAIDLTWEAATAANQADPIDHYVVQVRDEYFPWGTESAPVDVNGPLEYRHSSLAASTVYQLRVIVETVGEVRDTSSVVQVITRPAPVIGKPQNVLAELDGETAINLTWEAATADERDPIDYYVVQVRVGRNNASWVDEPTTVDPGTLEYRYSPLAAATKYWFRVKVVTVAGATATSIATGKITTFGPGSLSPPRDLEADLDGDSAIDLTWTAAYEDPQDPIASYQVRIEEGSAGYVDGPLVSIAEVLEYRHSDLVPLTRYTFMVIAITVGDVREWATIEITTPASPGSLSPPQNVMAELDGDTAIDLTWEAATEASNDAILHYVVQVKVGSGTWGPESTPVLPAGPLEYRHSSLTPSTEYSLRVIVETVGGATATSDVAQVTTSAGLGSLGPPRNLEAVLNDDETAIDLSWDAATQDDEDPISHYVVQVSPVDTASWGAESSDISPFSPTLVYQHSPLTPSTEYFLRVIVETGEGARDTSEVVDVETSAVSGTPGAPPKPRGTASADESEIEVNWSEPEDTGDSDLTVYQLQVQLLGETSWETLFNDHAADADLIYIYDDVSDATSYRFKIRAKNNAGWGPYSPGSDWVDIGGGGIVLPPINLTAVLQDDGDIRLSWDAPETGPTPDNYIVEAKLDRASWSVLGETTITSYNHQAEDLGPGETWSYRVRSELGDEQSDWSNIATATTNAVAPGKPRDLNATPATTTSVELTWTAPASNGGAAITGYHIQGSEVGSPWEDLVEDTESADRAYTHTGIDPNSEWRFRVAAINSAGEGPWSATAKAKTEANKPSVPRLVGAEEDGPNEIVVGWFRPENDGGAPITGYRIQTQPPGKNSWEALDSTDASATFYRHSGLEPGSKWTYRVAASNKAGRGVWSSAVMATTETTVPSVPRNLSVTTQSSTEIRLTWTKPASDGGLTLEGYRIEYLDNNSWQTLVANSNSMNTGYLHRGLDPGSEWTYRVSAINSKGIGPATNGMTATTDAIPPGLPENVMVEADGAHVLVVAWDPPLDDGGSAITGYRVELFILEQWRLLASPTGTRYRHTGLDPESTYSYRISAVNAAGTGAWSEPVEGTTGEATPTEPLSLMAEPDGANVIILTWEEPLSNGGYEIEEYEIRVQRPDTAIWERLAMTGTDATSYRHTGLPAGSLWAYQVRAINSFGTGDWSDMATGRTDQTPPAEPRNLVATNVGSDRIDLSWDPPVHDGGSALWAYNVEYLSSDSGWRVLINMNSTATTFTHGGLDPGSSWTYRVVALNHVGQSEPSLEASARTDPIPPDPPENVTAEADGPYMINVRWSAPLNIGGAEIMEYVIESTSGDGLWDVLREVDGTTTEWQHRNLEPASTWTYRVKAVNEAGTGLASATATATTEAIRPDPPTYVRATADGTSEILVTWRAPEYEGGADILHYRVEMSTDGLSWHESPVEVESEAFRHMDLDPASTWYYRVSAVNAVGPSDPSEIAFATTDATVPDAPEEFGALALDHETVRIAWNAPAYNGGAEILGYALEYSLNGEVWEYLDDHTSEMEYIHEDLMPATDYHYRVAALNIMGAGAIAGPVSVETPARVPDAPENLIAAATAPTVIELSWTPPAYDGGARVIGYKLETSSDQAEWRQNEKMIEGSRYEDTNVSPGETRHYRVYAVNIAGPSEASNTASATTDDPVARANRVNQAILPVFMATATEGVVKAISDRIETSSRDDHKLRGPRLRAADRLTDLADGMSGETSSGMVGFWFRSEITSAAERGSLDWEGRMLSAHTGMDVEIMDGLRGGLALSRSNGSFDFTDAVDARSVEGDLDAWVVSATPYVSWRVDDKFSIWGAAGKSMGATTVTDAIAGAREADSRSSLLAVGMSGWLMSGGGSELNIRAEGWQSSVTSEASDGISEYVFTLRRVRAMLDWTDVTRFSGGHELHVKVNGGMRSDLNEGAENRSGVELGGGMRFQSPENRLKIEGMGRYLFSADSDYSEWGFGGLIELDPAGERGLAMEVEPSYGSYESQTTRLYNRGSRLTGAGERDLLLAAKVQYRRPGAAAPYGRLLLGGERPTLVLGSMFPRLKGLSLEGTADRRGLGIGLTGGFRLR